MFRAFYTPRSAKSDPSRLLGFSAPINPSVLRALVRKEDHEAIVRYFVDPRLGGLLLPRSGVSNPKLFTKMFEALTGSKIEVTSIVLPSSAEDLALDPIPPIRHRSKAKEYTWIERVLENGLPDGRKRFILYVASRYLVNTVGLSTEAALERLHGFIEASCRNYGNCGKIYDSWLRSVLKGVRAKNLTPLSMNRLKEREPEVYEVVASLLSLQRSRVL